MIPDFVLKKWLAEVRQFGLPTEKIKPALCVVEAEFFGNWRLSCGQRRPKGT